MLHVWCYATQAPPGSNTTTTKAIHHHGRTATTQYLQQNQTTTITTTTTQDHHQHPSSAASTADITQLFVMHLDENRQQTRLMEYRKELLANVSIFDLKDKKSCLMWLNQCAHTAINVKMSLRELIIAKSGPIVSTQVQNFLCRVPEATDTQIKQHILECFSNVGTRTEPTTT